MSGSGEIVAVCVGSGGIPKAQVERCEVGTLGLKGDGHRYHRHGGVDLAVCLLSEEVYEEFVYEGEHCSIGQFAPERCFTAFSFSKTYGMAGNRTGYLVGPVDVVPQCRKVSTHTFYSAPTAGQLAGLAAIRFGAGWVERTRELYRDAGYRAAELLGVARPQGSTFLFLDVRHVLDDRGVFGFLEDCLDDGLVLAPGPSFGAGFESHVRLCFTSAPPDRVEEACRRLAKRIC